VRDELAGRLLDQLLEWSPEEQSEWMFDLRRLAAYKFDQYEAFAPGERFFERLARWLGEFPDPEQRRRLITFLRRELIFISRDELDHAIACVYPDVIKRDLIRHAAAEIGIDKHHVKRIVTSKAFRSLRRKTLYLGLSDGARMDRLRRASPELSHEQFWLSPELGPHAVSAMAEKLTDAIEKMDLDGPPQFRHVVLVDDFYGSGTSLLHRKPDGSWGGKLRRAQEHLNGDLRNGEQPLLADDVTVTVVLYVASDQAHRHIKSVLEAFEPTWELRIMQLLPDSTVVTDPELLAICEWFYDDVLIDKHKGRVPLGYERAALPLVLHHNTPNNSICPLWADSVGRDSAERHALFPRYERHHVDRP